MGLSPESSPEQSLPFLSPPHSPPRAKPPTYGFPYEENPPAYLLLPVYPFHRRRRRTCCCLRALSASSSLIAVVLSLLLVFCAFFLLWPSDPEISIVGLRLNRFRVLPHPVASIDVAMGLDIKIRNPDFFSMNYSSIDASIFYRGALLGSVSSVGGRVAARKVSYVEADLHLDGVRVLEDAIHLIGDLAKGSVEFDTVSEIQGWIRVLFFDVPIKGKISCLTRINPDDQTISYQDCYPA